MPTDNIFSEEYMNDMLLNPKAYGIPDGLENEENGERDIKNRSDGRFDFI